nr:histidine kinase [Kribbella sandramycini]
MVSLSERAVRAERERIARDMHDALGHRLSLLSVHAGALEFRPDMPPEELARAAGVIRVSARESVEDLREIVGVLRSGDDGPRRGIAKLIAESRAAGMVIELVTSVEPAAVTDLTAYRIVQEGLTNARKHAPRQPVRLTLSGTPGAELAIELVNRVESGSGGPGSRVGLVGLAERVSPAGGRIEYGTADGEFRLAAWLPWRVLR